jgi:lipoprotein NlpI
VRWLAAAALVAAWIPGAAALEPGSELAIQLQAERRQAAERAIAQATARIESGALDDKQLADAFRKRGIARSLLQQHGEAAADFSRAVELDPLNPQVYEERAIIHLKLREFKQADTDLEMALGLDSGRAVAEREKGRLAFYRGDYEQAAQHFARLAKHAEGRTFVYAVLWLHIAIKRGGLPRRDHLATAASVIEAEWPVPVVRMFLGEIEPREAVAAADSRNPQIALMQRCEALFYAGQSYLIRGDTAQARAVFQGAVATGVTEFLEYDWALRELELMDGKR